MLPNINRLSVHTGVLHFGTEPGMQPNSNRLSGHIGVCRCGFASVASAWICISEQTWYASKHLPVERPHLAFVFHPWACMREGFV